MIGLQRWIIACQPLDACEFLVDELVDSVIAVKAYTGDPTAHVLQYVGIRTAVEDNPRNPTSIRQDIRVTASVELQIVQHFGQRIDQQRIRPVIAVKANPSDAYALSGQHVRIGAAAERGIHYISLREELVCSPATKHARIRCPGEDISIVTANEFVKYTQCGHEVRVCFDAGRCHILRDDRGALSQAQIKRNPVRLRNPRIRQRKIQCVVPDTVIHCQRAVRDQEDLVITACIRGY